MKSEMQILRFYLVGHNYGQRKVLQFLRHTTHDPIMKYTLKKVD